jgi:hypothetical protein
MVIVGSPPNRLKENQEHKVSNSLFQQFIVQWLYNQSTQIKGQPISNQQVLGGKQC